MCTEPSAVLHDPATKECLSGKGETCSITQHRAGLAFPRRGDSPVAAAGGEAAGSGGFQRGSASGSQDGWAGHSDCPDSTWVISILLFKRGGLPLAA